MNFQKSVSLLLLLLFVCVSAFAQTKQIELPKSTTEPVITATPTPEVAAANQADDHLSFMAEASREPQEAAPSTAGLMLRTLGALLLIVGLIVAAAWGMKRFGGARFGKVAEDAPKLNVLNSVALGDKRSVAVIQFGHRTILIGSTPQSITLLAETVDEPQFSVLPSVAEMLGEEPSFAAELSAMEMEGRAESW